MSPQVLTRSTRTRSLPCRAPINSGTPSNAPGNFHVAKTIRGLTDPRTRAKRGAAKNGKSCTGCCTPLEPVSDAGTLGVGLGLLDAERRLEKLVGDKADGALRDDLEGVGSPAVVEAAQALLGPDGLEGVPLVVVHVLRALHLHPAADGVERIADRGGGGAGGGANEEVGDRGLLLVLPVDPVLEKVIRRKVKGGVRGDADQGWREALVEGNDPLSAGDGAHGVEGSLVGVVGEGQPQPDGVERMREGRGGHSGACSRHKAARDCQVAVLVGEYSLVAVVGSELSCCVGENPDDVCAVALRRRGTQSRARHKGSVCHAITPPWPLLPFSLLLLFVDLALTTQQETPRGSGTHLPEGEDSLVLVDLHESLPDVEVARALLDARAGHCLHLEQELDPVQGSRRRPRDGASCASGEEHL